MRAMQRNRSMEEVHVFTSRRLLRWMEVKHQPKDADGVGGEEEAEEEIVEL